MLWHRRFAGDLHTATPVLLIAKDTAGGWQHAGEQTGAGGIAQRIIAVRIGETHSFTCETINVWSQ